MGLPRTVRWVPAEGDGLEHFELRENADGFTAAGVVVGRTGDRASFGLTYRAQLNPDWTFSSLLIERLGRTPVSVTRDRGRAWWAADRPMPHLAGCTYIDLVFTPFTNSLPINGLRLEEGKGRDITVAHFDWPDLEPRVARQRYTCLDKGRRYLYEDATFDFSAELQVDEDGLVEVYPELFRRSE